MPDANILGNVRLIRNSKPIVAVAGGKIGATGLTVDARKVDSEIAGVRKPGCSAAWAIGLQNLARTAHAAPPPVIPPAPTPTPPPPGPLPLGAYGNGTAIYRSPRGGVENVALAKQHGLRTALLNLGDHSASEWAQLTAKLEANAITWGWWAHCHDTVQLGRLLGRSNLDNRPVIGVNVEEELVTTMPPRILAYELGQSGYKGDPCLIGYGWQGYVDPDGSHRGPDYGAISTWVVALEMFPQDAEDLWRPSTTAAGCFDHARKLGARRVMQIAGAYPMSVAQAAEIEKLTGDIVRPGAADPAWWNWSHPTGVYTVDDTGENWAAWGWA